MRFALIFAAMFLASPVRAADAHPLDWLVGCWSTPDGNSVEVWDTEGDDLVGFAVTVKQGRVQFYETLTIRLQDGGYVYTARPRKQRETAFAAERIGANVARFTNPGHDFPQVIEYQREGDALTATISLLDGTRKGTFAWRRCEDIED